MPVPFLESGKSPSYIAAIQTCVYMNVLRNVRAIIKIKKLMMYNPAIQQQNAEHKDHAQQHRSLAQSATQPLQGSDTHRCDVNMQKAIQL